MGFIDVFCLWALGFEGRALALHRSKLMDKLQIDPQTESALLANLQHALGPMGFSEMGHAKRLDFMARLLGFQNHGHRVSQPRAEVACFRVFIEPLLDECDLHPVDRDELDWSHAYVYRVAGGGDAEDRALDEFHQSVPIKVLEDFDIRIERVPDYRCVSCGFIGPELDCKAHLTLDFVAALRDGSVFSRRRCPECDSAAVPVGGGFCRVPS